MDLSQGKLRKNLRINRRKGKVENMVAQKIDLTKKYSFLFTVHVEASGGLITLE